MVPKPLFEQVQALVHQYGVRSLADALGDVCQEAYQQGRTLPYRGKKGEPRIEGEELSTAAANLHGDLY